MCDDNILRSLNKRIDLCVLKLVLEDVRAAAVDRNEQLLAKRIYDFTMVSRLNNSKSRVVLQFVVIIPRNASN